MTSSASTTMVTLIDVNHHRDNDTTTNSDKNNDDLDSSSPSSINKSTINLWSEEHTQMSLVNYPDPSAMPSSTTCTEDLIPFVSNDEKEERQYLHIQTAQSSSSTTNKSSTLYEVSSLPHSASEYSSFFCASKVISNPQLYLLNRIDPLFLLLTYLPSPSSVENKENEISTPWQPWDQIVQSYSIPLELVQALSSLSTTPSSTCSSSLSTPPKQLQHLFNVQEIQEDLILYQFNPQKVTTWLNAKLERTCHTMQQQHKAKMEHAKKNQETIIKTDSKGNGNVACSTGFNLGKRKYSNSSSPTSLKESNKKKIATVVNMEKDAEKGGGTPSYDPEVQQDALQLICEYISPPWRTLFLEGKEHATFLKKEKLPSPTITTSTHTSKKEEEEVDDDLLQDEEDHVITPPSSQEEEDPSEEECTTPSPPTSFVPKMSESDKLMQYTSGLGSTTNGITDGSSSAKKNVPRSQSHGLKKLAKVNTKGTKSIMSFFGAAGSKKKKAKLS